MKYRAVLAWLQLKALLAASELLGACEDRYDDDVERHRRAHAAEPIG